MNFLEKNKEILIALGIVSVSGVAYFALGGRKGLMRILKLTEGITESAGQVSFSDEEFQKEMESVGWHSGWDWCVLYSEYVWKKTLPKYKYDVAEKLFTANSQQTWANFKKHSDNNGKYFYVSKTPKKGSMAIWQSMNNPSSGHAGIVTKVHSDHFETQEGNYSGGVTKVPNRKYLWSGTTNDGFKLIGFINVR